MECEEQILQTTPSGLALTKKLVKDSSFTHLRNEVIDVAQSVLMFSCEVARYLLLVYLLFFV